MIAHEFIQGNKLQPHNPIGIFYSIASEFIQGNMLQPHNPIGIFYSITSEFIHWERDLTKTNPFGVFYVMAYILKRKPILHQIQDRNPLLG